MSNTRALGPGTVEIDGETCETLTVEVGNSRITVRELLMEEFDQIYDATKQPDGTTAEPLYTRMQVARAIVDPVTPVDKIGKFTSRKWITALQTFNKLNSLPEANPTVPAGSAGPTSPSGGESSPETSADSPDASTSEWSDSQPTP